MTRIASLAVGLRRVIRTGRIERNRRRAGARSRAFPEEHQSVQCVVERAALDGLVRVPDQLLGHCRDAATEPCRLELIVGGGLDQPFQGMSGGLDPFLELMTLMLPQ